MRKWLVIHGTSYGQVQEVDVVSEPKCGKVEVHHRLNGEFDTNTQVALWENLYDTEIEALDAAISWTIRRRDAANNALIVLQKKIRDML